MTPQTQLESSRLSVTLNEIRYVPAGPATAVRFRLHWLREVAPSSIESDLGRDIPGFDVSLVALLTGAFQGTVTPGEHGWLRLRIFRSPEPALSGLTVQACAAQSIDAAALPDELPASFAEALSREALAAFEARATAALATACRSTCEPLFDYGFDATPEGLAACQAACQGLLPAAASEHVRVYETPIATAIGRETVLELHLPYLDRKQWASRAQLLARIDIEAGDDGRLFAYTVDAEDRPRQKGATQSTLAFAAPLLEPDAAAGFTLAATDCRSGEAGHLGRLLLPLLDAYGFGPEAAQWLNESAAKGGSLTASLTVSAPGEAAKAWLRGPAERDNEFFDVYSKVAIALQQATRRWIPYAAFSNPGRYENLGEAYPLVFFAATRPCSGRPRSEFAYDLVSPDSPGVARPWAARPLAYELGKVQQFLLATGRPSLARMYAAWRAPEILAGLVRKPRHLNSLLTGDAFFIDRFVRMGLTGRALAPRMTAEPRKAVKELTAFVAEFASLIQRRLRRCYAGLEFGELASILLVEATLALAGGLRPAATLRLTFDGQEQTFCN